MRSYALLVALLTLPVALPVVAAGGELAEIPAPPPETPDEAEEFWPTFPATCFPQNNRAALNLCIERSANETEEVLVPVLVPGAGPCVVSDFCAPLVGFGHIPVEHPALKGSYVEVTAFCPLNERGCRVKV